MRRTKEEAEQTKEEIFHAGIKVFAQKGYTAGTLADVAREAGVTRGAIYWHFRNKEAFFQEVLDRLNRIYDDLVGAVTSTSAPPHEAIAEVFTTIIRRFIADEEFRAMQELVARTVFNHAETFCGERPIDRGEQSAVRLLGEAIRRRQIYDGWTPEIALTAVSSYVAGVFMAIMDRGLEPSEAEIRQLAGFLTRGLAPTEGIDTQHETRHATHA